MSSDNPSGADNQQETASAGSSETARQALDPTPWSNVKVQSDPHGDRESGRNDLTTSHAVRSRSNNMPKVAKFLVG